MFENKLFPYNSVLKLTITNMTPMEDFFSEKDLDANPLATYKYNYR